MGQKVHPKSFRLGIHEDWLASWFPKKGKHFAPYLREDIAIREHIQKKHKDALIDSIRIERRSDEDIKVKIKAQRVGMIFGRKAKGLEELREELKKIVEEIRKETKLPQNFTLDIEILELRRDEVSAAVIARQMAQQIERRVPYRRVLKRALATIMRYPGVLGAKVQVSGRLDGAEIARKEWLREGRLPLQTIRSKIDYAFDEAKCTYGVVGIKVWIYKGDVFEKDSCSNQEK